MSPLAFARIAAAAWLVAGLARIVLALTGTGPDGPDGAVSSYAIGIVLSLAVAGWLWLRPGRGSTLGAVILGVYAVIGFLYYPIVGPQPWFLVLSLTGLAAFVLSLAAAIAVRRTTAPAPRPPRR